MQVTVTELFEICVYRTEIYSPWIFTQTAGLDNNLLLIQIEFSSKCLKQIKLD